jgi:tetratricopeptide (TPR) repeat protein
VRLEFLLVAGLTVPEESFVISFGDVLVSPHSISFSHTFCEGVTLLLGMRGGGASGFVHSYWDITQNAVSYFDRGLAKQKKGDLDGAMADYDQAIKLNPIYAAAYSSRGLVRQMKGDLDGAMADSNQAIKLSPIMPSPTPSGE